MTLLEMPPRVLEDTDLEFDLDATPQCELPWHEERTDPATWKAIVHCPNKHQILGCDPCKQENDKAWEKRKGVYQFHKIVCMICKGHVPSADPFHWEEL